MLTQDALRALLEQQAIIAAESAVRGAFETDGTIALPDHFKLHDIEHMLPQRRRQRGAMRTSALADFATYVRDHRDGSAKVFVDQDQMRATAVLNLGTPAVPGHADDTAVFAPEQTAPYKALLATASGQALKQSAVAEFIEDWAPHVTCRNDEGPIPVHKAIAAVRRVTIESIRKLESQEQNLRAERTAFESVAATSVEPLPTFITFTCGAYLELAPRAFELRLGVATGGDKPMIQLRIINPEQHRVDMAAELASRVRDVLGGDLPVLVGTYKVAP